MKVTKILEFFDMNDVFRVRLGPGVGENLPNEFVVAVYMYQCQGARYVVLAPPHKGGAK